MLRLFIFLAICSPVFSEGQLEHLLYSEQHQDGEKYILNQNEYDALVAVYGKKTADYVVNHTTWKKMDNPLLEGRYYDGNITVNSDMARKFRDSYTIVHEAYHYYSDVNRIPMDRSYKKYRVDCLELSIGKLCWEQEAEIARAIGILLVGHRTIYGIWNGIENFDFDLVFLRRSLYGYAEDYMRINIPENIREIDPTDD